MRAIVGGQFGLPGQHSRNRGHEPGDDGRSEPGSVKPDGSGSREGGQDLSAGSTPVDAPSSGNGLLPVPLTLPHRIPQASAPRLVRQISDRQLTN